MITRPIDFFDSIYALFTNSKIAESLKDFTALEQARAAITSALTIDPTHTNNLRLLVYPTAPGVCVHPVKVAVSLSDRDNADLTEIHPDLPAWLCDRLERILEGEFVPLALLPNLNPSHPTSTILIRRTKDYSAARTDGRPSEAYAIISTNQIQIVEFHEGNDPHLGTNGYLNEDLILILAHRSQQHQSGPFASRENALAVTALQQAGLWLYQRRVNRIQAGTSGTQRVDAPSKAPNPPNTLAGTRHG